MGEAAPLAVAELVRRGVRPWFVLDEGGAVAHEAFPGVAAPIGVIGVTEKGTTSLELRVEGRGGHASTPGPDGPDRPAGPGDRPARPLAVPGQRPGADRGADAPDRPARAAGRCARCWPTPPGSARC